MTDLALGAECGYATTVVAGGYALAARQLAALLLTPKAGVPQKFVHPTDPVARWYTASSPPAPAQTQRSIVFYIVLLSPDGGLLDAARLDAELAAAVRGAAECLSFSLVGLGEHLDPRARAKAQALLDTALVRARAAARAAEAALALEAERSAARAQRKGLEAEAATQLHALATALEKDARAVPEARAVRALALDPLCLDDEEQETPPAAVGGALERLDAALALAATLEARGAGGADSDVASQLEASLQRARAAGVPIDCPLAARAVQARDNITETRRLTNALEAALDAVPPQAFGSVAESQLQALEDALAAARGAGADVGNMLDGPLAAAAAMAQHWAAVLEVQRARASPDLSLLLPALDRARAVGLDVTAIGAVPVLPPAAAPPGNALPWQPREVGTWQPAGAQMAWDKGTVLGEGSAGTVVYTGEFVPKGRAPPVPAAVKRLRRDPGERGQDQLSLVKREVDHVFALQGKRARVARYFDLHADDDWIYLWFERCRGSLALALALDGAPAPPELAEIEARLRTPGGPVSVLREVAEALRGVHAHSVSHNDLNATNVLIAEDGALLLHDLQLAVATAGGASNSFSLTTFGLEINMARRAPEMLRGAPKLTNKVDVWALGVLAYQLVTQQPSPFAPSQVCSLTPAGSSCMALPCLRPI